MVGIGASWAQAASLPWWSGTPAPVPSGQQEAVVLVSCCVLCSPKSGAWGRTRGLSYEPSACRDPRPTQQTPPVLPTQPSPFPNARGLLGAHWVQEANPPYPGVSLGPQAILPRAGQARVCPTLHSHGSPIR